MVYSERTLVVQDPWVDVRMFSGREKGPELVSNCDCMVGAMDYCRGCVTRLM